ncbi:ATP-binding protein [Paraliomyxa miuraensis]|uniref:ATP-binding protein n=1 Tax=Paraliomyxa miuraensis TaxID=376150 RepID=UPI0022533AF4|nr:ATP-binding protein [Paraliomyxa miuraensis]MCX4240042.1 ATP-binding protein [Paraliomyxa miuraensis]
MPPASEDQLVGPTLERWRLRVVIYLLMAIFVVGAVPIFVVIGQVALVMGCAITAAGFAAGYVLARRGRRRLAAWLAIMALCGCLFVNTYNFGTGLFETAYFVAVTLTFLVLEREDSRTCLAIIVTTIAIAALGAVGHFGEAPLALPPAQGAALRVITVALTGAAVTMVLVYFTRISVRVGLLQHQLDASEAANQAKSVFLAHMSHELRTPMNGVLGMLSVLERTPLSEEQQDFLRIAHSSGQSLLDILSDILDISKVEAGQLVLEQMPLDLRALVEDVAHQTAVQAADKDLDIVVHYPPTTPDGFVGDPTRIRQILVNLATNAIKFTPSGHIVLQVECQMHSTDRATVVLSVIDTGIGIGKADQARVFDRFQQVDGSPARAHGGVGLGLAIVKHMVELMNGELTLESTPGQGSEFRVVVELALAPASATDEPAADLDGVRVFLVEPLLPARRALTELLTAWGAEVEPCSSVAAALDRARARPGRARPDAVVLASEPTGDGGPRPGADAAVIWMTRSYREAGAPSLAQAVRIGKPVRRGELATALLTVRPSSTEPRVHAAHPSATPSDAGEPRPTARTRVLVVEDNPINQRVAMHLLRQLDCDPDIAESGTEALRRLEDASVSYELILMDIQMPYMDGVAATAAIREREPADGPRIPIVAVTAHAMDGDRQRFLDAGMDDYLSKPVRRDDLARVLRRFSGG